jgi:hypothetical protein
VPKMRTVRTKVYSFNELSEESQAKAIELNSIINISFDWWIQTYEDVENIGLKITSFDLDRNKHADGKFIDSSYNCANLIVKNHGENCKTYKLAKQYIIEWDEAIKLHSDGINTNIVMEGKESDFDYYLYDREAQFLKDILNTYADILQSECEYLQSEEAIKETIVLNEYEFLKDGSNYTL